MKIDWGSVKKQVLWDYEDLIKKLQDVLAFSFVQESCNHTMRQAQDYARAIQRGYLQNRGDMLGAIESALDQFEKLDQERIGTYAELISAVATRDKCEAFLEHSGGDFDQLIQTLNYLLRWVLPFKTPLREFVRTEDEAEISRLEALKKQKIGSNLDLLEAGRGKAGRDRLASLTGIPASWIIALVHRADISRLAFVRGRTVRHLCSGGYDTLEKIAGANLTEMESKMELHYRSLGKTSADFKAVIPLAWMVGGAQILPRVVED